MKAVVLALLALVAAVNADATASLLWPLPQSVSCDDVTASASPQFSVSLAATNPTLQAAATRYQVPCTISATLLAHAGVTYASSATCKSSYNPAIHLRFTRTDAEQQWLSFRL